MHTLRRAGDVKGDVSSRTERRKCTSIRRRPTDGRRNVVVRRRESPERDRVRLKARNGSQVRNGAVATQRNVRRDVRAVADVDVRVGQGDAKRPSCADRLPSAGDVRSADDVAEHATKGHDAPTPVEFDLTLMM